MNRYLAAITLLAASLFFPAIARCDTEQDKAAVRDVVGTQQADAWNKHDAKAYAGLFTEDGDCVNVVGWWWKGRAEIEQKLTDAYVFVFKESVLTIKGHRRKVPRSGYRRRYYPLDHDGRSDAERHPRAPTRNSDPDLEKTIRQMARRRIPEHQRRARNAVSKEPARRGTVSIGALS